MEPKHDVRLITVDKDNWRDVAGVRPLPDQERFVAPITHYLCLAHYDGVWNALAIERGDTIVGHLMWAVDDDGSTWLGGLVIDASVQKQGIGRAAIAAFIDRFTVDGAYNIAISADPENAVARALYADVGFVDTGEMAEHELVSRLQSDT